MLSFYDLPLEVQTTLRADIYSKYFDPNKHVIEVVEDPKVHGTYAIRVVAPTIDGDVFLIWYHYGEWEECKFKQWPPTTVNI